MRNFKKNDPENNINRIRVKSSQNANSVYIFLLSSIIACLNILYFDNYATSMTVISLEIVVLVYCFIKKDITRYFGFYLIFLCLSFEFEGLVGIEQFYGFKDFRILGVNLGIIALLPVAFLAIFRGLKIIKIKREHPSLFSYCSIVVFISITGLIFGLFQILINDNNIQNMDYMLSSFIGISYNMSVLPLLIILTFAYILSWEHEKILLLEEYLMAILIGVVVSMIVSLVTGTFGSYGGVYTLLVTNVVRYVPFMLLFPFYKKHKTTVTRQAVIIFGIIGAVLVLLYNTTGKTIVLYALVPLGVLGLLWKRKKVLSVIFVLLLLPLIAVFAVQAIEHLSSTSVLFNSKFNQAMAITKFWETNWLQNMPASPRFRVVEFISIFYEYLNKPWFFIFGKGYMGTVTDHTGMLTEMFSEGAFSMNQWRNGTFYRVHETLNVLFLNNGLFGLLFYLYIIKSLINNFAKNPWILIGGFWFLMIYGFSVTMSAFGLAALLLGYIDLNGKQEDVGK